MLHTSHLTFSYPGGKNFRFPDIDCPSGDHLLVLGESGTGKTTLLHLIAGILRPQSGEVNIAGKTTSMMNGRSLDRFRGEHVGIVFQTSHFVQSLSVLDNLILPHYLAGRKIDRNRARTILNRLGIGDKSSRRPSSLSIGEQQRVAIARAVMNEPELILADEPTSALDDKHAHEVIALLEEQASAAGAALIIVTHDNRLKERYTNRVVL
jgi:ABC-type lipoprotein export system ATPase subunit